MISVIVPVYYVEKYIERCLECLIRQTEKDIEIINYDEMVYDFYVNIDGKEDISAHFADAEQVYSGTEKAYIVKSVTEKELSDKLKGVKVNSYLRILEYKN